jgi:hypothetical protein
MSLPVAFLEEKDKEETQPIDLYEVDPAIDRLPVPLYYANSRLEVTYDGHTYIPLAIQRSGITKTADGAANKVSLTLDNIGRDFIAMSQNYRITGLVCNVKQIFRNLLTPGCHRLIIAGQLANPVFNGPSFSADVIQHIYSLQKKVPLRTYQRWCNSQFGDEACMMYKGTADSGTTTKLNDAALDRPAMFFYLGSLTITAGTNAGQTRTISASGLGWVEWDTPMPNPIDATSQYHLVFEPFKAVSATADSGTTTSLIDSPLTQEDEYWTNGDLTMLSGQNAGQKRKVSKFTQSLHKLEWNLPMPYAVINGDTYMLRRGCDKTYDWCQEQHHNEPNFSGFLHIPATQNLRRYGE